LGEIFGYQGEHLGRRRRRRRREEEEAMGRGC